MDMDWMDVMDDELVAISVSVDTRVKFREWN